MIHTLCLSESAIAALSSVNVPRHASLLRLAPDEFILRILYE